MGVFLVLPPALGIRLIIKKQKKMARWAVSFLLGTVGCYALLMGSVRLTNMHFEKELAGFDLDGDGTFSGDEITPAMKGAMNNATNDTGRALAPLTGIAICPVYAAAWHMFLGLSYLAFIRINNRRKRKKGVSLA